MGAYWGSRWFAVLGDLKTARVEQVDLRPDGVVGTSDRVICPTPPELAGCRSFESEADAVKVVREHILDRTEHEILELVCAIEMSKLKIEENRLLKNRSEYSRNSDRNARLDIEAMAEKLKRLRQLRRSKVAVS